MQRTLPLLADIKATTTEGVIAKAKVIGSLWSDRVRTGKTALVQSLVDDVLAVLDGQQSECD